MHLRPNIMNKVRPVQSPSDIESAKCIVFPGVGAFGACVEALQKHGLLGSFYLLVVGMEA